MIYLLLIIATLATSFVSGVLSMAGGMILMGVFSVFLSVPAAMVLHGIAQAVSNGSRVWLHRKHIRWPVLVPYALGSFVVLGVFVFLTLVPDKGLIFVLIGTFPFIALAMPKSINLDMEKPMVSFSSGLCVTTAQMLAGASGPVLDVFYLRSSLNRHEVLGTKAITQTLGHLIKLGYYAFFLTQGTGLPIWMLPCIIAAAIAGNYLGKLVIDRINDDLFRQIGRYTIMIIGLICIAKGLQEWDLLPA